MVKKVGLTEEIKSKERSDIYIISLVTIGFFGAMILPTVDYRYQWSTIPFIMEIIGLIILNIGLIIMIIAMIQNASVSKLLDINKGQRLIDTRLYSHVRYPLYSGAILVILGLPFALGSRFSLIPAVIGVFTLIIRIKFEEEMFIKGMNGYDEYQYRVKFKIIPEVF